MKWITILFTLFIILIIVLADRGQFGILKLVNRIPYGDKAGHFILYGILTLLIDLTLFHSLPQRSLKLVAVISGLTLALLIGLEEFSQQYFVERTFSLRDLIASYLGVIFFSWLALRISRKVHK
ncbi:MAG: VanZ family protein [Anaerolineae bacterium]|nr:VanZ family protein [Anaerolineae bacterium]MCI0610132.1 VanZ family protein [Anaerolineae bacterium]